MAHTIRINSAPVLTLWAAIVAARLGLPRETALTVGQVVAGMTAHAKGVRIGKYAPSAGTEPKPEPAPPKGATGAIKEAELLRWTVRLAPTAQGLRAINKGELVKPEAVEKYLRSKFGDDLVAVRAAMGKLAASVPVDQLNAKAFHLYEKFRPEVPPDEAGWGAKGVLDLDRIANLS